MLHAEVERPIIEAVIQIGDEDCKECKEKRDKFAAAWKMLKYGKYIVRISKLAKRRTNDQNRMYWWWLGILAEQNGDDTEVLHQYFKAKFLSKTVRVNLTGEDEKIIKETKRLSTAEFGEYLESIRALVWDALGFWLPDPDPDIMYH